MSWKKKTETWALLALYAAARVSSERKSFYKKNLQLQCSRTDGLMYHGKQMNVMSSSCAGFPNATSSIFLCLEH